MQTQRVRIILNGTGWKGSDKAGAMEQMNSFEADLKEKGYRLTSQRKSVLKAAAAMPGHFTAEELHRKLNRSDIGIATVYRTVQLLQEMGYIKQAHIPGGSAVYEYTQDEGGHSHAHMQCTLCNTVLELREDMMSEMEDAVLEQYGFEVADHHIVLTGLCASCRRRELQKHEGEGEQPEEPRN